LVIKMSQLGHIDTTDGNCLLRVRIITWNELDIRIIYVKCGTVAQTTCTDTDY